MSAGVALERLEACDLCGDRSFQPRKEWKDLLLFGPERWRLVECETCRLNFINPRPTRSAIPTFYPDDYPAHVAPATQPKSWHRVASAKDAPAPGLWNRLRLHFRQDISWYRFPRWHGDGRVLDIGCGSGGRYLDVLKGLGWTTYGVEPSQQAVTHATAKGHHAVVGSAEEQHFDDESMDVVTMWHVLEHTHSPRKALESCFRTLRPGGQLSLCVPNWNSSQAAIFGRYWWSCDAPRHLFQFTKQTLTRYLEDAGFRIRMIRTRTGATSWQRAYRGIANDLLGTRWQKDSKFLITVSDGLVAVLSAVRFFGVGAELRVIAERPA
ncbi:MAG: class I SAM-dependent methyltransferase [Myxococcales bacterium]|nr:class I SAM-dependent methyltransferase [Myxococcales bacterium]